ncbi:MAG: hypothetical protein QW544_04975 [Candidatus Caldarchaeum sp.]
MTLVDPSRLHIHIRSASTSKERMLSASLRENDVKVLGRITHLPANQDLLKSGYIFRYAVKRTLLKQEVFYAVSETKVMLNNIALVPFTS